MQIVIDYQNTRQSWITEIKKGTIESSQVEALPWGLRRKMVTLLNALKTRDIKRIFIDTEDIARSLLEIEYKTAIQGFLDQAREKQLIKTIKLLVWYFNPHWTKLSDLPKSTATFCAGCTTMSRTVGQPGYCWVPGCSSHDKWKIVIGPSYTPPPPVEVKKAS